MLGWFARQSGLSYKIYDKGALKSASVVSSGIINPVTGHRFVKSWLVDDLIKEADRSYREIGSYLGKKVITTYPIWRHIPDIQAENIWSSRCMDPAYDAYLSVPEEGQLSKIDFEDFHAWGVVRGGSVVDTSALIRLMRERWITQGVLKEEEFDHAELEVGPEGFIYESEKYKAVILAGGMRDIDNLWFKTDVYRPAKGDAIICEIPDLYPDKVIKYKKFIVPFGGDKYWIGSNYQHDFDDHQPDAQSRSELEDWLKSGIGSRYEILDHVSGIRAATKYRRPLIGEHRSVRGLFLMNGLGTKGISLAPYFARKIIASIASGSQLKETSSFEKAFHV